jgi:hypothetical protein
MAIKKTPTISNASIVYDYAAKPTSGTATAALRFPAGTGGLQPAITG